MMKSFRKQVQDLTFEQLKNELESSEIAVSQYEKRTLKLFKENTELKDKIETALYELDILHEKVDPTEYSSIDSQFKRIIDILKNR